MKEEVYHTNYYRFGYRVEKQLLLSLKSIFEKYNSNVKQDYEDFQHVQVVWKKLKKKITENNKKLVIAQ